MLLVAASWASETCSVQLKGCIAIMQRDGIVRTPVPPSSIDDMPRHCHKRNLLNHLIKNQNQHSPTFSFLAVVASGYAIYAYFEKVEMERKLSFIKACALGRKAEEQS